MHPRFLEIEITGACTCTCKHCYGSFPKPGELSCEQVCTILTDARGFFDCIILSGGEPFLHKDLVDMVEKASEEFLVFITTSGLGVTQKHLRRIKNRAVLVFGLDGIGKTHDRYRGVHGAFTSLMRALDMARDVPKEVIVTLWKNVIPQIDDIIALCERHNAIVHFNAIIPVGRVKDNPEILPDIHQLESVYEKLHPLKLSGGIVLTDLHKITEKDTHQGIDLFCKGRYNITPAGDVRPCEFHYAVLGNINKNSLGDIIRQARKTELITCRENGFKDQVRLDIENPFHYHTEICHKIPCNESQR